MPKILPGQTDLYALTDSRLSRGRPLEEVADKLLSSGIHILQYREKRLPAGKMLEECRMLREMTRKANACFIVNDHIDIAMMACILGRTTCLWRKFAGLWGPTSLLAFPPIVPNRRARLLEPTI